MTEFLLVFALAIGLGWPLGRYLAAVMRGASMPGDGFFRWIEQPIYRLLGTRAERGMRWQGYAGAFLLSNLVLAIVVWLEVQERGVQAAEVIHRRLRIVVGQVPPHRPRATPARRACALPRRSSPSWTACRRQSWAVRRGSPVPAPSRACRACLAGTPAVPSA